MNPFAILGASMNYTKETVEGAGAIKGDKGDPGPAGPQGPKGDTGAQGPKGDDGSGVPAGGTTGQVLKKVSNDDGDVEWANESGGGGGGGTGSIITVSTDAGLEGEVLSLKNNDDITLDTKTVSNQTVVFNTTAIGSLNVVTPAGKSVSLTVPYFGNYSLFITNVNLYGFKIARANSNPLTRVEYIEGCTGFQPASMGSDGTFNYGSWRDAFFMPKPCVLNFDGTVAYYLNPRDMSKKLDGTAANLDLDTCEGNVMVEFPKMYMKFEEDDDYIYVRVADYKPDNEYSCWPFYDYNGNECDHLYVGVFGGYKDSSGRLRSVSTDNKPTASSERSYADDYKTMAMKNDVTGQKSWFIGEWTIRNMINCLLYLVIGNTDAFHTLMPTYNKSYTSTPGSCGHTFPNNDLFSADNERLRVFGITDYLASSFAELIVGLGIYGYSNDQYWHCKRTRSKADGSSQSDYPVAFNAEYYPTMSNSIIADRTSSGPNNGNNYRQLRAVSGFGLVLSNNDSASDTTYECTSRRYATSGLDHGYAGGGWDFYTGLRQPYGMAFSSLDKDCYGARRARVYCKPCIMA